MQLIRLVHMETKTVQGYRVLIPELKRAYDINKELFERYLQEGVKLRVSFGDDDFVTQVGNKLVSVKEESHTEGISSYLELVYDNEVCWLTDLMYYAPDVVFGVTKVPYRESEYVIEDVALAQGKLVIGHKVVLPTGDSIDDEDMISINWLKRKD